MKLIIDIPEQMYLNAKADILCGADILVSAIKNGIPLDKIRTEIRKHCERYMDGDIIADEVIQAVENIDKAKSEHKCHTCKHYTSGEYDGSCDSYVCEHYSGWESEDK